MTGLQLVQKTQQWKRTPSGEFWQRCLVRTADGSLTYVLVRDDVLARAA